MKKSPLISPPRTLCDKHGASYRLQFLPSREFWTFKVTAGAMPVGYAYCWLLDKEQGLRINDIRISNDLPARTHPLVAMFRRLLKLPTSTRDFQRRGIGTALLRVVIESARAKGFGRVTGEVKVHDLAKFGGLLDWYACEGFTVSRAGCRILLDHPL